jgi:hypothetical protein
MVHAVQSCSMGSKMVHAVQSCSMGSKMVYAVQSCSMGSHNTYDYINIYVKHKKCVTLSSYKILDSHTTTQCYAFLMFYIVHIF